MNVSKAKLQALLCDKARLDWLADPNNMLGNVQLPVECVERHIDSLRDAIDDAMTMLQYDPDEVAFK